MALRKPLSACWKWARSYRSRGTPVEFSKAEPPVRFPVCHNAMGTSYDVHIDRYTAELEEHCRNSYEALRKLRQRVAYQAFLLEKSHSEFRRELLVTLLMLAASFTLMQEQFNRERAAFTHMMLKEYAEKNSTLKRVVI
ncbi:hypothetical protein ERJ75_001618700 [Trypanosoma vivax]|uniref:Uncharacterized protein n=1 Tax=Trypanosoma vivax (strain Y486) TaxID=1055687 RepID=G0TTB8_TRYVY|nr:hypothetical protein TRVL_00592 [Trypanosoma vivax]KAH8605655.1 hypothetical protein ERJ75_001618700 [Trypanosoma vivax]CCC47199.1 conserved hypothetical protein [Trypanosoma vivax Y486]